MRYSTAPMCGTIKSVTGLVMVLGAGFAVASFWVTPLVLGAVLIFVVSLVCYLKAPVAYEITRVGLTVEFRQGRKSFGPIVKIASAEEPPGQSIRLWGNGGLFAGTGIFWNSKWGRYRAYITSTKRAYYLMVETPDQKVLISPEDPAQVLRDREARTGK